jgi:hypothetical protein
VDDLHNTGRELHDTDFGRLFHLTTGIKKTVGRYTGIRVDYDAVSNAPSSMIGSHTQNDVVADTDVTISPSAAVLFKDFLKATLILSSLMILVPVLVTLHLSELGFNVVRQHKTEVHVGSFLKLALTDEALRAVLGAGSPANTVVGVEFDTRLTFLFVDDLDTVVVDEHVC